MSQCLFHVTRASALARRGRRLLESGKQTASRSVSSTALQHGTQRPARSLMRVFALSATAITAGALTLAISKPEEPELPDVPLFRRISPRSPYAKHENLEILKGYFVLQACRLAPVATQLVWVARTLRLDWLLKATFMSHFCAGSDLESIEKALKELNSQKLLPILDVAVEADLDATTANPENLQRLKESVLCAAKVPGACVAVKLTALALPAALMRVSGALREAATGPRERFAALCLWGAGDKSASRAAAASLGITDADFEAMQQLYAAADELCALAAHCGVSLMVDAEQSYFQDAIDLMGLNLAVKYNRSSPVVFNTYQMYLKQGEHKLKGDLKVSRQGGWHFAAKVVRGAYMVSERERANRLRYESPIHETVKNTHCSYNDGVKTILDAVQQGAQAHVLIASHNIDSVSQFSESVRGDRELSERVSFGQLKGMHTAMSYALASSGLRTMKYMPYGEFDEVLPYLLRRAQENSAILGSATLDRNLLWFELRCRVREHILSAMPIFKTETSSIQ